MTFLPGSTADTDVTEFAYGFDQDDLSLSVKVKADGTATIPVTLPQDDPSKMLYVKAVDEAGNVSPTRPPWSLQAIERTPEDPVVPETRGDANGDGKADVTAVFDHGYGRTAIWNVTSDDGNAFHSGYIGWDSGEAGGFALYRTKPVQGDFDGDGRTELAMFREGAGRQVWLYPLVSDGNRYDMFPHVWTSPPNSWPLSTARVIGGDVDGDGRDDIVVQNAGYRRQLGGAGLPRDGDRLRGAGHLGDGGGRQPVVAQRAAARRRRRRRQGRPAEHAQPDRLPDDRRRLQVHRYGLRRRLDDLRQRRGQRSAGRRAGPR